MHVSFLSIANILVIVVVKSERACHQFFHYFTEETVSIGLQNKLRVGTFIPQRKFLDRSTDPCPTQTENRLMHTSGPVHFSIECVT